MSASYPERAEIKARIDEIESELRRLRELVTERPDGFPERRFAALEVLVGGVWYALPIAPIREVVSAPWVDQLPDAPAGVLGTFCYGREVVPMVDLGYRLTGQHSASALSDLVLLVAQPSLTGLRVPAVRNVVEIDPGELSLPAADAAGARFVVGSMVRAEGTLHILSSRRCAGDASAGG